MNSVPKKITPGDPSMGWQAERARTPTCQSLEGSPGHPGMGKLGNPSALGAEDRRFESVCPDMATPDCVCYRHLRDVGSVRYAEERRENDQNIINMTSCIMHTQLHEKNGGKCPTANAKRPTSNRNLLPTGTYQCPECSDPLLVTPIIEEWPEWPI